MIFRKFTKNHRHGGVNKIQNTFMEPDEIFLDSKNLENFNRQQFEGRIEKAISKKTINYLGIFFLLIIFILGARLMYLQIQNGDTYRKRSESNIKTVMIESRIEKIEFAINKGDREKSIAERFAEFFPNNFLVKK